MDRRRSRRWPRQLDARFWRRDEDTRHRAVVTNISFTGIFIRTSNVFPSGTRVRVELVHRGRGCVCEGIVARAIKTPSHFQTVKPSGMGVRFLSPSELVHELLPGVVKALPDDRGPTSVPDRSAGGASGSPTELSGAAGPRPGIEEETVEESDPRSGAAVLDPEATADRLFPIRFETAEEFRSVFERDMTTGGIFVATSDPPPMDSRVVVMVTVEESDRPSVKLEARVVHRAPPREEGEGENLLVGMGVQLTDLETALRRLRSLLD